MKEDDDMDTRNPIQKRSIETKEKIINKGFELMCQKGYYNTNTAEIAKFAGVSTGIIYHYFKDKKEIFIEGLQNYANKILFPMNIVPNIENIKIDNLEILFKNMIDKNLKLHQIFKKNHEEIIAMAHLDEDIFNILKQSEIAMCQKIINIINNNQINIKNPQEKIHIIISLVDNLCHEIAFHKHSELNYEIMQKEVIKTIIFLLKEKLN